jgi:hypothetical protein
MTPSSFTRFMDDMIEEFNAYKADKQQTFNVSPASMDALEYSLKQLGEQNKHAEQATVTTLDVTVVNSRTCSIKYAGYTFNFVEDNLKSSI